MNRLQAIFIGSDRPGELSSPESSTATLTAHEPVWKVIVLNDPVNLMSYVVMVFKRVFGYDNERAKKHMMEVHEQGRSLLWSGEREQAEAFVHSLQHWQLTAILETDDSRPA